MASALAEVDICGALGQPEEHKVCNIRSEAFVSELFRKEAVHHATRRLAGEVVLASSLSSRLLAGASVLVVIVAVVFAATASYARKETVAGWLTPSGGLIRLEARQGGIVETVLVSEGEIVRSGQPIATVRLSQALADGDSFAALSRSLKSQTEAAASRARSTRAALDAERTQLTARREALSRELSQAQRRATLQVDRVRLARSEVARAEALAAQGYLPRRELETRQATLLSMEQEQAELAGAALSYEREIGEVSARLAAIPIDLQTADAEAASAMAGLEQQQTQTEAQSSYVVVATVDGRVAALPVHKGQGVPAGAAVAVLTAGDTPLEAELYAPSRASGFIREGQDVRLMYQAFPYQKFGAGEGQVISVSRTVLAPAEVAIPGLQVQEPVFRVRVKLSRDEIAAYGRSVSLQPGMLLTADVVIDRRSLLEWLLDPLYAAGRRA